MSLALRNLFQNKVRLHLSAAGVAESSRTRKVPRRK
jgi:hypothetical protein